MLASFFASKGEASTPEFRLRKGKGREKEKEQSSDKDGSGKSSTHKHHQEKRKEGRDKSHASFILSYAMDLTGKGNKKEGHPLSHIKAK